MTQTAAPVPSATVLLVDDEAPIRRSLGPYLERGGYRVLLASDGAEALDLLASYQVDIIVSDVLMPRMDGRELVRRVRAGGAWTPIILLTQVDASYERVSALDDGAVDHRVREIRQALGDDVAHPTYIETVPSVGYRFRAEVRA